MMDTEKLEIVKLLAELERLGCVVTLEDGLVVFNNCQAVGAELMFSAAVEYRAEIADLLRLRQNSTATDKGKD
jgi:hypothetical protein